MNISTLLTTLLGVATLAAPAYGFAQEADPNSQTNNKYHFKRTLPTQFVEPYITTIYSADPGGVRTMRGDILHAGKDTIVSFAVNPSGVNFGIVTHNKKGVPAFNLYHTAGEEKHLYKFDTKHLGNPTAVTYTPDARGIVVAVEGEIYFLDPRTYKPIVGIKGVPVKVEQMTISPNGYYLAVAGDGKVIIYNLQENKIRKELSFDEKINSLSFSPDNSDFGVLTDDGLLTIYNTRTFDMRKILDDLGVARSFAFNLDGKYVAVVTGDETVEVINLLRDSDREKFSIDSFGITDVDFIRDAERNTIMVFPSVSGIEAVRLVNLKPFYNKLIEEEADMKMGNG